MEKLIKDFEIPNKKIETWKFTDLKIFFEKNNFEPFIKPNDLDLTSSINSTIKKNIFFDPKINYVIFENGCESKINIISDNLEIKQYRDCSNIKEPAQISHGCKLYS